MKIRSLQFARDLAERCALTSAVAASVSTLCFPAAAQPASADLPPSDASETEAASARVESPPDAGAGEPAEQSEAGSSDAASGEGTEDAPVARPRQGGTTAKRPVASVAPSAATSSADATTTPSRDAADGSLHPTKPPPLSLELLPPTAFPNDPITGIAGGSLSWVRDRLQAPYMPKYAGPPALRVGFSGSIWIDSSYRKVKAGLPDEDDKVEYIQQGRFTLRVTPVYSVENDWFIQSNAELVGVAEQDHTPAQYIDLDDSWIRAGKWKLFDVQVGRMQGFEVYHYGMGLDLNTYERQGARTQNVTPRMPYGADDLWDRGINNGAIAAHWYLPEWLRLEFLARFGLAGLGTSVGIRPAGVLDFGWLKLKGAYERRLQRSTDANSDFRSEMQGLGASLQFVLAPWAELGGNVAQRVEDAFDADNGVRVSDSHTTTTYGGFLNLRPYFEDWTIGAGYHRSNWENFNFDAFGERENETSTLMFAAVQYLLLDKLYIKYVLANAKAHIEHRNDTVEADDGFFNKSLSHRVRFMTTF